VEVQSEFDSLSFKEDALTGKDIEKFLREKGLQNPVSTKNLAETESKFTEQKRDAKVAIIKYHFSKILEHLNLDL